MKKYPVSYVEIMVSRGCNLSCVGCTSFCDYPHKGYFRWEEVEEEFHSWAKVIDPKVIGLIGGEPLINPDIFSWIDGVRKIFKESSILLVTNGLIQHRIEGVIQKLIDNSPSKLMISLHRNEDEILTYIEDIIHKLDYRFIKRVNHESLINIDYILYDKTKKFSIQLRETDKFLKRYVGYGKNIVPFKTEDSADAFKECIDRPIIYKGKLFRCGKIPFVQETLKLIGKTSDRESMELWKSCIDYKGLKYSDCEEKMDQFFAELHSPALVCKTCPSKKDEAFISHKENVYSKEEWYTNFIK